MSTKFVYHNNGKITRAQLSGIPIMSNKGVSSLSASNDGNYIIVKSGDTYSFEPSTAGLSAVTPQNLTNITANNKNYLLAIGNDNNFKQILFSNNTINNTFSYVNDQWVLDKQGLYQQYAETPDDVVNMFALPTIDKDKNTKIITPATVQTGKYVYNVKNVDNLPSLDRLSIDKEDINYTNSWGSNAHIIYVDRQGKLSSLQLKDSWYSGIKYNETYKRYEFVKLSLYEQTGNTKTVKGFALPIINSSKANDQISLPNNEQGEYIIDYSGNGNPTLKKITYISEVNPNTLFNSNPPTNDSLMVVNNNQFKTISNPPTSGNVMLKYNSDNTWSYVRVFSPRFTRYALEAEKDITLLASGTKNLQDIFTDLSGLQIENNSILHFKIYFYLNDVSLQEDSIGLFKLQRKVSTTETTDLAAHYIYNPVENLIAATFTFPYSGNMSSMQLVTSLLTDVKLIAGIQSELLVETQIRLS